MKKIQLLLIALLLLSKVGLPQNTAALDSNIQHTDSLQNAAGNVIFTKVEKQPKFPGDALGWRNYLLANLNPVVPVNNGAPSGTYNVYIQFVVSKDGTVSDVKALTSCGYGMEQEAVRLIEHGPKWIPGRENEVAVPVYRVQPITFVVSN